MRIILLVLAVLAAASFTGCAASPETDCAGRWAIAIHGGAGTLDREAPAEQMAAYRRSLDGALRRGAEMLEEGKPALDVCEAVVRILEDDPLFNAGRGAAFNEVGGHELDASIMDGATLRCGAVAGVTTVKNPVSLARLVIEKTRHVLLMGEGAEQFATLMGVERVPNSYFDTEYRRQILDEVLRERAAEQSALPRTTIPAGAGSMRGKPDAALARASRDESRFGTVGCVVLDASGNLAAATSTGGLTGKRYGRVGDAPIIGAGNFADDMVAVSGTGTGEEFIRHGVARSIAARMRFAGQNLEQACRALVFETLKPDDGGVIAVDHRGNISMHFNSEGMYRGAADSAGRFEVRIFEE